MRRLVAAAALTALLALTYAPTPAAAAPVQNNATYHTVRPGETLYGIAAYYGTSANAIAKANGIVNYDKIYAGQTLTIPGGGHYPAPPVAKPPAHGGTYVVRHGDTLYSIAASHGTTVSALMAANGISNPNYIRAGQTLTIPGGHHGGYPPAHKPGHKPGQSCGYYYTVKPGDTLSRIAYNTGSTSYTLARANNLSYPYTIYAGQSLHIPCGTAKPTPYHNKQQKHHKKEEAKKGRPNHCAPDNTIYEPMNGNNLTGTVHIVGTANIESFQFYKLEYAMGHHPEQRSFHSIGDTIDTPVKESTLGVWYVGNMPAGKYTLRLTSVDDSGQYPRPCDVRVTINH